ncbi:MAG: ABC transporter permease subunit [Kiritimatiellae bacterium]|nr:ABC transporter permease subunit [Kiritimatiellia bacterium]
MWHLTQIWRVAVYELRDAVRSRRAIVVLALYLVAAVGCMYGSISLLGRLEADLAKMLQLPASQKTGVVSTTLWKSKPFQHMVRGAVRDDMVYNDIVGKHPVELIYAWFTLTYAPLLVILVAGNRIADDVRSGAVRYMISRVSRGCWSCGKFAGQALMIGLALAAGTIGAYITARIRLYSAAGSYDLLLPMFNWSFRAWVYSFAYLGMALGVSHLTRSGSKATALGILVMALFALVPACCDFFAEPVGWQSYLPQLAQLVPGGHKSSISRSSLPVFIHASLFLIALGGCYLSAGFWFFRKRDC